MSLVYEITSLLKSDSRFVSEDGQILKNKITEAALNLDTQLMILLLSQSTVTNQFFASVGEALVFDREKFIKFINNKEFLPDSYTSFKNKIGLVDEDGDLLTNRGDVVLAWPYKDCILEGGQTKEDQKRQEKFWNEVLAPDEVDRLLDPKVLTNISRYTTEGEKQTETWENDANLFIRGNNLLGLASIRKKFQGLVKLVYIDPPYNINGDGFEYNDSFNHATWLTFMKNRLEIAKELLSKDGAIFVQIDIHELAHLKVLMDEIFERKNFIQLISVRTASPAGFKTVNPGPIDVTEYILFYTKDRKNFPFKKQYVATDYDENYNLFISNIDDQPENWVLRSLVEVVYEQNGIALGKNVYESNANAKAKWGDYWKTIRLQIMSEFALEHANQVVSIRDPHKPTKKLKELLEKSRLIPGKILVHIKTKEDTEVDPGGYVINGGALAFYSNKVKKIDGIRTSTELLTDMWLDISWDGIAGEGGVKLKNGKKPERLLQRIVNLATEKNDVVMDFFSGSGTTCAVALKMGRRFIGIEQLDYGENDSLVRLKNVVNGDKTGISKVEDWKGGGSFVFCELMQLNEVFIKKIIAATTTEQLLSVWIEIQKTGQISYKVKPEAFKANVSDFSAISLEDQKRLLLEVLDKNLLYVNYSEIEDTENLVTAADQRFNHQFYGGGKHA